MRTLKILLGVAILFCMVRCKPKKQQELQQDTITEAQEVFSLGDSSRVSVDWDGTYLGFMPCTDCEGTLTRLTLFPEQTFELDRIYWGSNRETFSLAGTFRWGESGGHIYLEGGEDKQAGLQFQVGENRLTLLNQEGNGSKYQEFPWYVLGKVGSHSNVQGTYWKLIELGGVGINPTVEGGKEAYFLLTPGSGKVYGNGGCNAFNGSFEVPEGKQIRFFQMASTMMACRDMEVETQYFKVFESADSFALRGDTLSLKQGRMLTLARFASSFPGFQ